MDLTPEQVIAQQKAKDAIAALNAEKAALKAKRAALRANVGKTFTDGDTEAIVTGFDKSHIQGNDYVECYTIHRGNVNCQEFVGCEAFLTTFIEKGAV